jgi:hypothetical protein
MPRNLTGSRPDANDSTATIGWIEILQRRALSPVDHVLCFRWAAQEQI